MMRDEANMRARPHLVCPEEHCLYLFEQAELVQQDAESFLPWVDRVALATGECSLRSPIIPNLINKRTDNSKIVNHDIKPVERITNASVNT